MAQTGFTPIQIYSSSTTGNTPAAADLLNSSGGSELAINIFDGKLFYKDNAGSVQVIGWKVVPVSAGGTGQTSYTDGQLLIGNTTGNTLSKATLTAGSGVTITNGAGAITINATGSGGTVTSVSGTAPVSVATGTTTPVISLASGYGDTQNPYASKTANYVLAAPNGSAGDPTFRALVSADIPSLSSLYIPYTGASSAIDLNAKTVVNIANLGVNTTTVPTIKIRAIGDNNSTSRIAMRGYSSDANSSSIRVSKFRGTVAAPQAPQSGDSLGKFELAGYGTTASDAYPQASFEGIATEAWGATARGTKTLIKVTPNTTITQVTAVTIDQDKSVAFAAAISVTGTVFASGVIGTSATGALTLPSGTTAQRPTPATGMLRYNSTLGVTEYYNGTNWYSLISTAPPPAVEFLVVAGGGGGGTNRGGGGGAGGLIYSASQAVASGTSYTITVGGGGAAQANGSNSLFGSFANGATGAVGGGASAGIGSSGSNGGSGGGAGANTNTNTFGGSATSGQGNAGGNGQNVGEANRTSGGGGGAGAAGANGSGVPNGGVGLSYSISGSSTFYAGGGGGGSALIDRPGNGAGAGGNGGGGAGGAATGSTTGVAGTANTGGGGGGGGGSAGGDVGGAGGSGVVIIRYADTYGFAASTTGSPTVTVSGGFRIYRWTGSGSITF
jgi:hypothetical protein